MSNLLTHAFRRQTQLLLHPLESRVINHLETLHFINWDAQTISDLGEHVFLFAPLVIEVYVDGLQAVPGTEEHRVVLSELNPTAKLSLGVIIANHHVTLR